MKKAMIRGHAVLFICPGCATIETDPENPNRLAGLLRIPFGGDEPGPKWSFNGSEQAPTLSPSLLTHFTWKDVQHQCHSFVENGMIRFLDDCSHVLRNQTVPLPDFPEDAFE